jgi:hypothetical protein
MSYLQRFLQLLIASIGLVLVLKSGHPTNLSIENKGDLEIRRFAQLLSSIETIEHLLAKQHQIRRHYVNIANFICSIRRAPPPHLIPNIKNNVQSGSAKAPKSSAGDLLFQQLARLYELPGGRDILESLQTHALFHIEM